MNLGMCINHIALASLPKKNGELRIWKFVEYEQLFFKERGNSGSDR